MAGRERLLAAVKGERRIAVEIKGFAGASVIDDLEKALGQFILYNDILSRREPDRHLYLAIRQETHETLFDEPIGQLLIENGRLRLVVYDPEREVILRWIP